MKVPISLFLLFCFFMLRCTTQFLPPEESDLLFQHEQSWNLASPLKAGSYTVIQHLYASPNNPRRIDYNEDAVDILSSPVDISPFTDQVFQNIWGFDARSVPLNGIVYAPKEAGSYPLVIFAHGNAGTNAASEFGFAYLGRHLASRGIIAVSIDQNYLNGFTKGEGSARAYLILKHIETLLLWNTVDENPLHGKINDSKIALVGHSRGGEAVVNAAHFNSMTNYPEDRSFAFNFHYPIKAVVSIAPVEGQYRPSNRRMALDTVHHLVLHGSQDGDIYRYEGLAYLHRASPRNDTLQVSYWIYGANHKQFNAQWMDEEDPRPSIASQILEWEDQQDIAKILLTAFIEYAFDLRPEYKILLKDYRYLLPYLPSTYYIQSYQSSKECILADFERSSKLQSIEESQFSLSSNNKFTELSIQELLAHEAFYQDENNVLFLSWKDRLDTSLSFQALETYSQEASHLAFDILVSELLDDNYIDFTIILGHENGIREIAFSDFHTIPVPPETTVLTLDTYKRPVLQSVLIPFNKTLKVTSVEFLFNKSRTASLFLDNIRLGKKSRN